MDNLELFFFDSNEASARANIATANSTCRDSITTIGLELYFYRRRFNSIRIAFSLDACAVAKHMYCLRSERAVELGAIRGGELWLAI